MSSYINLFLKTELTLIPKLLDRCIGNYYNNALCNGATWMFLFWYLLHATFDTFLNAFLKKMKYAEHVRNNLKQSLWYLGFYGSALIYCSAVLYQNNLPFFTFKYSVCYKNFFNEQLLLGFIVLATFYLHSALWERIKNERGKAAAAYLFLFFELFALYMGRYIENSFRLTIFMSIAQICLELARCATLLIHKRFGKDKMVFIPNFVLIGSVFVFVAVYIFAIPIMLGLPLMWNLTLSNAFVLLFQIVWLGFELHNSVCKRVYVHFRSDSCELRALECCLIGNRTDSAFVLKSYLREQKEREEEMFKLRKPKNRSTVMQTIKCMVTLKRKLIERRRNSEENAIREGGQEDTVDGKLEFNIQSGKTDKPKED